MNELVDYSSGTFLTIKIHVEQSVVVQFGIDTIFQLILEKLVIDYIDKMWWQYIILVLVFSIMIMVSLFEDLYKAM